MIDLLTPRCSDKRWVTTQCWAPVSHDIHGTEKATADTWLHKSDWPLNIYFYKHGQSSVKCTDRVNVRLKVPPELTVSSFINSNFCILSTVSWLDLLERCFMTQIMIVIVVTVQMRELLYVVRREKIANYWIYFQVIKEGNFITGDLGGKAKCSEFTHEIIRKIEAL